LPPRPGLGERAHVHEVRPGEAAEAREHPPRSWDSRPTTLPPHPCLACRSRMSRPICQQSRSSSALTASVAYCWAAWILALRSASQSAYPSGGSVSAGTLSRIGQVCQQRPAVPGIDVHAAYPTKCRPPPMTRISGTGLDDSEPRRSTRIADLHAAHGMATSVVRRKESAISACSLGRIQSRRVTDFGRGISAQSLQGADCGILRAAGGRPRHRTWPTSTAGAWGGSSTRSVTSGKSVGHWALGRRRHDGQVAGSDGGGAWHHSAAGTTRKQT
jgi:hypothetical protein